jgi:hypothetical protein
MVNLLIKIDMLKKFWIKQTFLEQSMKKHSINIFCFFYFLAITL